MAVGDGSAISPSLDASHALIVICSLAAAGQAVGNGTPHCRDRPLAVGHGIVAWALAQKGESAEALSEYRQARDIISRLKEQSPDSATLPKDLAWFEGEIAKLEQAKADPGTQQPEQAAR